MLDTANTGILIGLSSRTRNQAFGNGQEQARRTIVSLSHLLGMDRRHDIGNYGRNSNLLYSTTTGVHE